MITAKKKKKKGATASPMIESEEGETFGRELFLFPQTFITRVDMEKSRRITTGTQRQSLSVLYCPHLIVLRRYMCPAQTQRRGCAAARRRAPAIQGPTHVGGDKQPMTGGLWTSARTTLLRAEKLACTDHGAQFAALDKTRLTRSKLDASRTLKSDMQSAVTEPLEGPLGHLHAVHADLRLCLL